MQEIHYLPQPLLPSSILSLAILNFGKGRLVTFQFDKMQDIKASSMHDMPYLLTVGNLPKPETQRLSFKLH